MHTIEVFYDDREEVAAFLSLNLLTSGVVMTPPRRSRARFAWAHGGRASGPRRGMRPQAKLELARSLSREERAWTRGEINWRTVWLDDLPQVTAGVLVIDSSCCDWSA